MASEHSTRGDQTRHVTRSADTPNDADAAAHTPPTDETTDSTPILEWDQEDGRHDPEQRFAIYRLCDCPTCGGQPGGGVRCPTCRGEGRIKELVATCGTAEAVGVALVTLGREGEWSDCPIGLLDRMGEKGQKWLVSPWERSQRNVSDAARTLRKQRYT